MYRVCGRDVAVSRECILKKPIVDPLYALPFDISIDYEEKRMQDGQVVLSTAVDELYICDKKGKKLCKGKIEEGRFSGYKCTYDYDGECMMGKRYGRGKEYCMSDYDDIDWHFLVRDGMWENDAFIEGRINDVLATTVNDHVELVHGEDVDIVTKKD